MEGENGQVKVKVQFYGTLSRHLPGYRHASGLDAEIPDGATVSSLLELLGISKEKGVVVLMDGRILKADDKLKNGSRLQVMQAFHGG